MNLCALEKKDLNIIWTITNELSDKEKDTFEDMKIVQEMYARGFEFVKIDIYRSKANRFQIVDGKRMPAFSTIDGLGDKAAEMIEDEASKGKFLSREDVKSVKKWLRQWQI